MYLELLDETGTEKVYKEYMVNDFPQNELKPLRVILKLIKDGVYEPLALTDGNELFAYAFLVKTESSYLLDYLAVRKDFRGKGFGTELLKMLSKRYSAAHALIAEVEDPTEAQNEEERNIRERRIDFYFREFFEDTGVRVKTFGVDFYIINMKLRCSYTQEEIKKIYCSSYDIMLSPQVSKKAVKIKE